MRLGTIHCMNMNIKRPDAMHSRSKSLLLRNSNMFILSAGLENYLMFLNSVLLNKQLFSLSLVSLNVRTAAWGNKKSIAHTFRSFYTWLTKNSVLCTISNSEIIILPQFHHLDFGYLTRYCEYLLLLVRLT